MELALIENIMSGYNITLTWKTQDLANMIQAELPWAFLISPNFDTHNFIHKFCCPFPFHSRHATRQIVFYYFNE